MALFLVLMGYIGYVSVARRDELVANGYNTREDQNALRISRGSILAKDGSVLAETVTSSSGEVRNYPYGSLFDHIVGYSVRGKAGVEASGSRYLTESNINLRDKIMNELTDEKNPGDNIVTTLDVDLQKTASDALGSNQGSVVALDPESGEILAMVSKPGFDPNTIDEMWDTFNNSELYNRSSQGQYAPGSTFKVVTALAYMRQNSDYENYTHTCTGSIQYGDLTIKCAKGQVHGTVNFREAFAVSCNTAFVDMAMEMDAKGFQDTAEDLLFNTELPYDLESTTSSFPVTKDSSMGQQMMSAIGQAEVTSSPLHMAMIVSAIANDGMLMKPYVMEKVVSDEGDTIKEFGSEKYGQLMTIDEAAILAELMTDVVANGTGSKLQTDAYEVVGKTGTAEYNNDKDDTHSWFIGYAVKNGRKIAIAVIAEGAGSGSEVAVPIAKEIFDSF